MTSKNRFLIEKKYLIFNVIFVFLILLMWLLGTKVNVDVITVCIYVIYIFIMYKLRPLNMIPFSWIIVMSSLNIIGVFLCQNANIYLIEMDMHTSYCNSLAPLVLAYILMMSIMLYKKMDLTQENIKHNEKSNNGFIYIIIGIVSIGIIVWCLIRAMSHPYYVLKVTRNNYYINYLNSFEQSIKSHYFMLIPIFVILSRKFNRKLYYIIFVCLSALWLFLIGEKFGSIFFLLYLIIINSSISLKLKQVKKYIIILMVGIFSLLGVVYFQRTVLSNNSNNIIGDYFYQRFAQSGEVWWGTYQKINGVHINEFEDEIKYTITNNENELYGQWKMMVTCTSALSAKIRAETRVPFSMTTTSSIYYFFGIIGIIILYPILGYIYSKVIFCLLKNLKLNKLIETIILIRILFYANNLIFASDLAIISPKGLIYIITYIVLTKIHLKNKLKEENITYEKN